MAHIVIPGAGIGGVPAAYRTALQTRNDVALVQEMRAVTNVESLCNPLGFVAVDAHQRRTISTNIYIAVPQIPPRNITWFIKGKWVHWVKIGFEKYFLARCEKEFPSRCLKSWH